MRGEATLASISSLQNAALLLDLHAAGVHAELGEVPFDWLAVRSTAPGIQPARKVEAAQVEQPARAVVPVLPRAEKQLAAARVPSARVAPVADAKVWVEGQGGGLVLVVHGPGIVTGRARELLGRMLKAAGVDEAEGATAWVGCAGACKGEDLAAALKALAPQRVLVLGQTILGHWLGKSLGVEGWQAAKTQLAGCEGARVGVTYPPDLLLAQPLFKRLAWQHLQAWMEAA